jgi:predicted nucleic acid-binding protein
VAWSGDTKQLIQNAYQLAIRYGLSAIDALHIAVALQGVADEFITTEKPTKPLHRVPGIKIISI